MAGASRGAERPSYEELEARVVAQDARIVELERQVAEALAVIAEFRARLGKDSSNSSRPPSSDGYAKPSVEAKKGRKGKKDRSLRKRSGRKPGGQDGHEGAHLQRVEVPDGEVLHEPQECGGCGGVSAGSFPTGVEAPVQYGGEIRALGVYL